MQCHGIGKDVISKHLFVNMINAIKFYLCKCFLSLNIIVSVVLKQIVSGISKDEILRLAKFEISKI